MNTVSIILTVVFALFILFMVLKPKHKGGTQGKGNTPIYPKPSRPEEKKDQ